jgi:hypothetical protein
VDSDVPILCCFSLTGSVLSTSELALLRGPNHFPFGGPSPEPLTCLLGEDDAVAPCPRSDGREGHEPENEDDAYAVSPGHSCVSLKSENSRRQRIESPVKSFNCSILSSDTTSN